MPKEAMKMGNPKMLLDALADPDDQNTVQFIAGAIRKPVVMSGDVRLTPLQIMAEAGVETGGKNWVFATADGDVLDPDKPIDVSIREIQAVREAGKKG